MNKAVLLVLIIVIIAVFFLLQPKQTPPAINGNSSIKSERVLDCTIDLALTDIDWNLDGTIKYERGKYTLEGILSTSDVVADVIIIFNGDRKYLFGTLTPLTNPLDLDWYDVTDVNVPELQDLESSIGNNVQMDGLTCKGATGFQDSIFELPEDVIPDGMRAGGFGEYYA